ncbi:MAG TPA: MFS transporter, partial [Trueperaceae bacterium]|nr:MFS transporter [Trueperaceae bacterium]
MARLDVRKTYALVTSLSWLFAVLPMPVMVLLAQSRGISLTEIGVVMALYSVTVAALEVPSGALADTLGRKRTFLLGGLLAIASRVAAVLAMDTAGFIVFALLFGVSRALTSGTLEAWFVDALQEEDASVDLQPALAAAGSFQLAGLAIGTLAGGALPDLF